MPDKWESIADRKIREAIEAGAFDNLSNRGQPILLEVNPFQDPSLWMAHHLLRVNGFAPAWIERSARYRKLRRKTPSPAARPIGCRRSRIPRSRG
jgi:hypothetical protein